jgi:peptidoglycan hydrolase-like protein with peptidoglycan-binding domain
MTRRRTAGVVAGVLSVGAVAAAVTVLNLPPASSTSMPTDTTTETTTEITKETLIDREDHDGTLGHGDTTTVSARGGGTVTRLPASGSTISRGQAIYRVDNKAITLLYGTLPAYRTLAPGVTGADVKQFEKNLWALGYRGFTVDSDYTSSTADAVKDWQDDLGLRETGRVETSQISYAGGPVRIDSLTVPTGAVVQPGADLLKVTGTTLVATVDLKVDAQRLARRGATVQVALPDGKTVPGKIIRVESVVQAGDGPDAADVTVIEVTIGFTGAPKGLDQAAVTVAFTASERKDVLTVPVAALLALAEGGYGVSIVDGTGTRFVAVQTGLFADGKVEISGTGLAAGMKVGMPA